MLSTVGGVVMGELGIRGSPQWRDAVGFVLLEMMRAWCYGLPQVRHIAEASIAGEPVRGCREAGCSAAMAYEPITSSGRKGGTR